MAQAIETHYDQLNVNRSAPLATIRAAYRSMSLKYHPDRNPDPDALRIMQQVNQAWDVLRDPALRAKHDRWISEQELRIAPPPVAPAKPARAKKAAARQPAPVTLDAYLKLNRRPLMFLAALVLLAGVAWLVLAAWSARSSALSPAPAYFAQPWVSVPASRPPHGYLQTDRQDATPGVATLEINNLHGIVDVELRLYRDRKVVRSMYVHHQRQFLVDGLASGTYTLKYRIESDGKMRAFRARESFTLEQPAEDENDDMPKRVIVSMNDGRGLELANDEIPVDQF